jgi:hypothetical protein
MPLSATPAAQMNRQFRVSSSDAQTLTDYYICQCPLNQQVRPAIKTEFLNIYNSRQ